MKTINTKYKNRAANKIDHDACIISTECKINRKVYEEKKHNTQ